MAAYECVAMSEHIIAVVMKRFANKASIMQRTNDWLIADLVSISTNYILQVPIETWRMFEGQEVGSKSQPVFGEFEKFPLHAA